MTWLHRSRLRTLLPSSDGQRKKSHSRRNTEILPTTYTQTSTNVSDTVQESFYLRHPRMLSENTVLRSRRHVQTSSVSTTSLTLSLWSSAYFLTQKLTRHSIQAISATASSHSSTAWSSARKTPRPTCRTASSSQTGAMRRDWRTT